jgi:hypothetical protein
MEQSTPVEILSNWDFYIFGFGLLIRFLASALNKVEDHTHDFETRHLITVLFRVTLHVVASLGIMLSLPHFIVTTSFTIKFLSQWSFLGSLLVGFAGYDLIKWFLIGLKHVGRWIGVAAKHFGSAAIKKGVSIIENWRK